MKKTQVPPSKSNDSRGGARAFIQAQRITNTKHSAMFHPESATDNLSDNLVKIARKSGVLNIANRSLQKIPSKVWRIHDLDEKDKSVRSVSLDNPSEEKWWEFVDLNKLIVANNCIKAIPPEIGQLVSLQTLDVHDNQVTSIPQEIGNLGKLKKLDVSHNQLNDLPVEFFNLKQLGELRLNNNQLESMSKEISQLAHLNFLYSLLSSLVTKNNMMILQDVSFNKLTSLPDDLGFLSCLSNLNISNNNLEALPQDFGGLTGLRELDASENSLVSIPNSFSELIHLEILRLQNNKLEALPEELGCVKLKELYLQNNQINEFTSESVCNTKVELLDLRNNKISNFVVNREDLEFVDRFYLENNNISALPNDLAVLPSLKHLSLEGNPLRGIRPDILKRGTQGLLKYLRSRLDIAAAENDGKCSSSVNAGLAGLSVSRKSTSRHSSSKELGLDQYKLKNTKVLSLASRQVRSIEEEVFMTAAESGVNKVDLSKNMLIDLPLTFENLSTALNELILDFNNLTSLPCCICACVNLQYLSFQNNQVGELPEKFTRLVKLREVNFGYNKFSAIPPVLYDLKSLEIVIAPSNKLTKLEIKGLERLHRLAVLDLRNNDIEQIPPELGLLTQLRSLNIEGNAFRVPGHAVLSKGTEAILAFLRNRIQQN